MADAGEDASIDVDMLAHEPVEDADDAQCGTITDVELIAASANGANRDIDPNLTTEQFDRPFIPAQKDLSVPFSALGEVFHEKAVKRNGFAVVVPPAQNRWEYKVYKEEDEVDEILEEYDDAGFIEYLVLFSDGSEDVVSLLFGLPFFNTRSLDLDPHFQFFWLILSTSLHSFHHFPILYLILHCSHRPTNQRTLLQRDHLHTHFPPHTLERIFSPHLVTSPAPKFLHQKRGNRARLLIYYCASTGLI